MRSTSSSLTVAAVVLLVATACAGAPTSPQTPQVPLTQLTSAPTTISLAGRSLTLAASLWRDFMPIVPPDGRPLTGMVQLTAADAAPVPDNIQISGAWVVNGTEVWTATGQIERRPNPSAYEVVLRGGPAWTAGTTVDVVIELTDGTERALLRRAAVSIDAVH